MEPLWISSVTGLYQEFFQPDPRGMASQKNLIDGHVLDAGLAFWRSLFIPDRIRGLIELLQENIYHEEYQTPKFLAILSNKDDFIARCIEYSTSTCENNISERDFFRNLETLSILCKLYSVFEFRPFELTLQNGFLLNEVSSKEIASNCLVFRQNPYLEFVIESIIPEIIKYSPSVLFICGKVGYFSASVAMIIRKNLPEAEICLTRHASEYYSINKITKYIKSNHSLFRIFDSIILEDFDETERKMIKMARGGQSVSGLPHVVTSATYSTDTRASSSQVPSPARYHMLERKRPPDNLAHQPERIYDVHFDPYVKCYWNKCVFCGINKKYPFDDASYGVHVAEEKLGMLCANIPNGALLWFIDEALPPEKLSTIADHFVSSRKDFVWQARCRIDRGLLQEGLPEKLARSGLKELRLGVESASLHVLNLMKKFPSDFNLDLIRQVVDLYSRAGISLHFPIIIGFPGETDRDRQLTYEFLSEMRSQSDRLTFNINIFNFDVSSPLFKAWDQYQISHIRFPCPPSEFVGNIIEWDDPMKIEDSTLEQERNSFMRTRQFSWMPLNSLISPVLFYRFCETARKTLVWKSREDSANGLALSKPATMRASSSIVVIRRSDEDVIAYNWDTHHYMSGNQVLIDILAEWSSEKSVCDGIRNIVHGLGWFQSEADALLYIDKLVLHGHLVPCSSSAKSP